MSDSEHRDRTDALLDLLVYAPIGLLLDAQAVTPDLARRGRQHSVAARQIGELVVKRGLRRLDEVLAQVNDSESAEQTKDNRQSTVMETHASEASSHPVAIGPTADDLAIPDYDLLAASQVVKRLSGLGAAELEAVRVYEAATRDRRTILHKISRLQA